MEIAAIASFLVLVVAWLVLPLRASAPPVASREGQIMIEELPPTSVAA